LDLKVAKKETLSSAIPVSWAQLAWVFLT
jgi:hypothetical protein